MQKVDLTTNILKEVNKMKAVVLKRPTEANDLIVTNIPIPQVRPGWVLIQVKGLGINRSELFTRKGQSPSVKLPRVLGIECVGIVSDPSDSQFKVGQRVISMMGGLGRDFDGSYAEYTLIPSKQVYPIDLEMDWADFAAIPEMYYTSWCSLVDTLKVQKNETLLIRGATSSVGLASIQIAKKLGATVVATTRNSEKATMLKSIGADSVVIDDESFNSKVRYLFPNGFDKILELIGTSTLLSSFKSLKKGGILCMTGILGGKWEIQHFAPMEYIPSGSYFTIYDSQIVNVESLNTMFHFIKDENIKPIISKIFTLDEIAKAHILMEENKASGKIVVIIDNKLSLDGFSTLNCYF